MHDSTIRLSFTTQAVSDSSWYELMTRCMRRIVTRARNKGIAFKGKCSTRPPRIESYNEVRRGGKKDFVKKLATSGDAKYIYIPRRKKGSF